MKFRAYWTSQLDLVLGFMRGKCLDRMMAVMTTTTPEGLCTLRSLGYRYPSPCNYTGHLYHYWVYPSLFLVDRWYQISIFAEDAEYGPSELLICKSGCSSAPKNTKNRIRVSFTRGELSGNVKNSCGESSFTFHAGPSSVPSRELCLRSEIRDSNNRGQSSKASCRFILLR